MGDLGELGPLDIQISRKDEIWAQSSILNVDAAVKTLEATAKKMFFDYLYEIKQYNRAVTYRTAADIAVELTGSCSDRRNAQPMAKHEDAPLRGKPCGRRV